MGGGCDLMDGCDAPALALCETSRATLPHPVSLLFLESVFKPIIQHASPSGGEAFDGVYWRLVKYVPRYSLGSAARERTHTHTSVSRFCLCSSRLKRHAAFMLS